MINLTILQKKQDGSCQFGKIGVLANIIIEELNSCKIAQLFFVSVSGEKKI